MARTLEQIYNEMTLTKESNAELDELLPNPDTYDDLFTIDNFRLLANTILTNLSVSKVAVWRLFLYVPSVAIWTVENLIDIFKADTLDIIANNQYGQLRWYPTVSKQFQLGDQLVWDGTKYIYEVADTTKQIVTQAAATVDGTTGLITLKVAKGVLPAIVPLSSTELNSFTFYIKGANSATANDAIIPAGTKIDIVSAINDDLKFASELFYDPLILASDGTLLSDPSTNTVEDAINDFINTLPFDSKFKVIDFVDAVQAAEGVENFVLFNVDAKSNADITYTDVLAEVGQLYITFSGYLRMATNFGLDEYYDYPTNTIETIKYTES
jgi:hypothetical protein